MVTLKSGAQRGASSNFGRRLGIAYLIGYCVLSLIVLRLWYLQCLNGSYFRDLSENNRIRTLRTAAPRGSIYDRDGRLIVGTRPAFDVSVMLEDAPDVAETVKTLASVSGHDEEELMTRLHSKRSRPFEPQILISDVSRSELARIKVNRYRLPGVIVNVQPLRTYPFGSLAAQLFGYSREISKPELSALGAPYQQGDIIGKAGLEKIWESELGGDAGYVQVEVDARGRRRRELGIVDYLPGDDLYTTLDLDIQSAAEAALAGKRGAVVAIDPKNGDVLAFASAPSYDANLFSGAMLAAEWDGLRRDKNKPLSNRVLEGVYPPGSTFKLILAVAGLAENVITPETTVNCPGYFKFGRRYHCHKRSGHGLVNLRQAITMSCNVYFYNLGTTLGVTLIHKYADMFGLGKKSGINVSGEMPGINPSAQWKRQYFGERWYPGDTVPITIGQGFMSVTPLQLAVAMSALSNGGKVYRPRLVQRVVERETGRVVEISPELRDVVGVNENILKLVRDLAIDVVNNERGTAKRAALEAVVVGGKTGTAQVTSLSRASKTKEFQDHAWFVSFAPAADPMIAMAIIVENAGHGGVAAAPISKQVMEVFFRKRGMIEPEVEVESEQDNVKPTAAQQARNSEDQKPAELG